jgi:hypothetical protein
VNRGEAYALYFCAKEYAYVIGGGVKALEDFRKLNGGKHPPANIWDNTEFIDALKKAGISIYAKVPAQKENVGLFKKYGAGLNTLVICAPNGDRLATFASDQCTQSAVSKALKTFKETVFMAWQRQQDHKKKK